MQNSKDSFTEPKEPHAVASHLHRLSSIDSVMSMSTQPYTRSSPHMTRKTFSVDRGRTGRRNQYSDPVSPAELHPAAQLNLSPHTNQLTSSQAKIIPGVN